MIVEDKLRKYIAKYKGHNILYEHLKNKKINRFIEEVDSLFLLYSFIIDENKFLNNFSNKNISTEIGGLYTDIFTCTRGIYGSIREGSVLGGYIINRSIFDKLLILGLIFEENDKKEIEKRILLYKDFGLIGQYFLGKNMILDIEGKEHLNKIEKKFLEIENKYRKTLKNDFKITEKNYTFEASFKYEVENKKLSTTKKLEILLKTIGFSNNILDSFKNVYSILSKNTHGNSLNFGLLNYIEPILGNNNEKDYSNIKNITLFQGYLALYILVSFYDNNSEISKYIYKKIIEINI